MGPALKLRAAVVELKGIVATLHAGGSIEAGRLGWPTVLSDAGLITIRAHGLVEVTDAGRRIAALPLVVK